MSAPEMLWALHPGHEHCHAVAPDLPDSGRMGTAL
jgi:hypothetical protein